MALGGTEEAPKARTHIFTRPRPLLGPLKRLQCLYGGLGKQPFRFNSLINEYTRQRDCRGCGHAQDKRGAGREFERRSLSEWAKSEVSCSEARASKCPVRVA